MKKILTLLMLFLFAFALTACDDDNDYFDSGNKKQEVEEEHEDDDDDMELMKLTIEELAAYDGKDGSLAYIVVNDVIYDVTDEWNNGEHNGVMAGTDATEAIGNAPHGTSILEDLEIVGELIVQEQAAPIEYTLAELAMYDGLDGNPAYVAVNGIVYDVTDEWNNGEHQGQTAGTDISGFINGAPHGTSVLDNLEQVGVIIEE